MGLCHGCGLFGDSSVRFGELLCGSGESLDCGDLAGMEGFHASKESSFRIFSSAHFQLHQRLCPAGNVPPYLGSPTLISIAECGFRNAESMHKDGLHQLASFRNPQSAIRIKKGLNLRQ